MPKRVLYKSAGSMISEIPEMRRISQIHFVGIGGSGMCGIAEVLINQGYRVSGSDIQESATTRRLRDLGAEVFIGQGCTIETGSVIAARSLVIFNTLEWTVFAGNPAKFIKHRVIDL